MTPPHTMDPPSLATGLNQAQQAAVTSPAPVIQILAPPGSGKTKTLTSRVSHLLQHHGYAPWNIICLTFTIKSAREMRERIAKLIGNGLESKVVLGTFHSVCLRYLRTYGHLIGLRKGFSIADSSDTVAIITRITKQLKISTLGSKVARSRISRCKARNNTHEDIRKTSKKSSVDENEFVAIFEAYETHLEVSNLLDYDDLLLRCVELLRLHPDCVSSIEAVLIDEFQDTNHVQFELMSLFAQARKRVTTVGDPDQSIYGWRSAEITNLSKMRRLYPETLVVHLENNYRSAGAILLASLEVIQQDEARPDKPLLPTHCPGTIPALRHLPHAKAEAEWIVSEIKRCISLTGGQLLTHSDFAILLRSASLSRQIESAMGRTGMPYRMVGGARFFDRSEIKLLLDYLRVINQPDNTEALARIINVPSRRIGDTTIKGLLEEASTKSLTLWTLVQNIVQGGSRPQTKITTPAEKGLSSFYNLIVTARNKLLGEETVWGPKEIIEHVIHKLDFKTHFQRYHPEDHENRWANVEELFAQASDSQPPSNFQVDVENEDALPQIEGIEQSTIDSGEAALSCFLENVALSTELQRDDDSDSEAGPPQARVTISTIHAAKGLEWPVVFVPSVYHGSIPHSRAEDCDEERRLLYVAMTRAQALLYLSYPKRNSTTDEETTLSPFISTKQVGAFLTDRGPTIQNDTVQDISRILKRDCPSPQALLHCRRNADNAEDDLWPYDGTENLKAVESKWISVESSSNYHSAGLKRRNTEEPPNDGRRGFRPASSISLAPSHNNTSMNNRGSFTITPHASGFVSASKIQRDSAPLQRSQSMPSTSTGMQPTPRIASGLISQTRGTASNLTTVSSAHSTFTGAQPSSSIPARQPTNLTGLTSKPSNPASLSASSTKRQRTGKLPSNQGSLSAFFKPISSNEKPEPAHQAAFSADNAVTISQSTNSESCSKSRLPPLTTRTTSHALLQGSRTAHAPHMVAPSDEPQAHTTLPAAQPQSTTSAPRLPMATLSHSVTNLPTEPQPGVIRKALGMGRPTAPWSARGGRPFKPPRPSGDDPQSAASQ